MNFNNVTSSQLHAHLASFLSKLAHKKSAFVAIALCAFILLLLLITLRSQSAPDFSSYPAGIERKTAFINYLYPLIEESNALITKQRETVLALKKQTIDSQLSWWQQIQINKLAARYKMDDFDSNSDDDWKKLSTRVNITPPAMALAQAAKESGWGTSRFASEGNNFFGQWCYTKGCGLIPKARQPGKSHEVAVFTSAKASVQAYMLNINTHQAYRELRKIRGKLQKTGKTLSGIDLVEGLNAYSERGSIYVKELRSMIKFNELDKFDG